MTQRNYMLTQLSPLNTLHLRRQQTAVLRKSSVRTILRFHLIVLLRSILHRQLTMD